MKYRNLVYCKHHDSDRRAYLYELPLDKDVRYGNKLCVVDNYGEHTVTVYGENWLCSDRITKILCEANGGYFPPAKVIGEINTVVVRQEVVTKYEQQEEPRPEEVEPWF